MISFKVVAQMKFAINEQVWIVRDSFGHPMDVKRRVRIVNHDFWFDGSSIYHIQDGDDLHWISEECLAPLEYTQF